ncbi:MAG: peptidase [Alphaproteobacteria bacterium]|nr:MAG: peptidase [Alphaproteobacteria bacterium]
MTGRRCSADEVVAIARSWIGTPYLHQASCRGAGTDCLGLLRGIWRTLYGSEPEAVPPYTADWCEPTGREALLEGAGRHLRRIAPEQKAPGDVLVFRMLDRGPAKHVGILARRDDIETVIHAYSGRAVCESPLGAAWRRRIAGVFRFPGIE